MKGEKESKVGGGEVRRRKGGRILRGTSEEEK